MYRKTLSVITCSLLMAIVPDVRAQHGHGEGEEGEHGKPAEFVMPTTYKGGMREIEHRLHEIAELMESGELEAVHAQADVIRKVGKMMGQLALKKDSGVPRTAVREINLAGKALAAHFDAIDKAGDSGDLRGTKKVYHEMVEVAETLQKYAPKEYKCPMSCEGEKTYDKQGKCPKCGMKLQDVKSHLDHNAKHGGVFFMAPDQHHHVEGTISDEHEFRIYFYDEYTKAIPVGKFTAEAEAWTQKSKTWRDGAKNAKALVFRRGPGSAYLSATVDSSIRFPIGITARVNFSDGEKAAPFSFEFAEPSEEHREEHESERGGHAGHDDD